MRKPEGMLIVSEKVLNESHGSGKVLMVILFYFIYDWEKKFTLITPVKRCFISFHLYFIFFSISKNSIRENLSSQKSIQKRTQSIIKLIFIIKLNLPFEYKLNLLFLFNKTQTILI